MAIYMQGKVTRVKNRNDVPTGKHYAIIVYEKTTIHHEGDERSRTHPGHGYPAHTETLDAFEHYVTQDKHEWLRAIEDFAKHNDTKDKFVCFEVPKLAKVATKVVVDVE